MFTCWTCVRLPSPMLRLFFSDMISVDDISLFDLLSQSVQNLPERAESQECHKKHGRCIMYYSMPCYSACGKETGGISCGEIGYPEIEEAQGPRHPFLFLDQSHGAMM